MDGVSCQELIKLVRLGDLLKGAIEMFWEAEFSYL